MANASFTTLRFPEQADVIETIVKLNPNIDKNGTLWVRDVTVSSKWVKTEGAWPLFRRYKNPFEVTVFDKDPNEATEAADAADA